MKQLTSIILHCPYYTVIRWIKLLRRGAIFELDKRGDICWNLPETEK